MEKTALIAMSGGVDSSVAALLTHEAGYRCLGCNMRLVQNEEAPADARTCCSLEDAEDARSVARRIGIPFQVFNFTADFDEAVVRRFVSCYENGGTPNPCLDCNRYLKFDRLMRRADELGYEYVVTGHYAVIDRDARGKYHLKKAPDPTKDQSYFLCCLTQAQLARTLFPLGGMQKAEVRKIAEAHGFLNAKKRDSQDICFVPDGDYAAFLRRYTGKDYPAGDFILADGRVVGRHHGIVHYTVGQRRGLGVAWSEPLYVVKKNLTDNTITLGREEDLYVREFDAVDFNWVSGEVPAGPIRCMAVTRYHQKETPATVTPTSERTVRIAFDEPHRAVTAGQAAVLYDGDDLLGGGTIAI